MKVFTVIPAYNEEKTIGPVVKESRKYSKVIVVDDASKDMTAKNARKSGAIVKIHNKNMGYGKSVLDGINLAVEKKADYIITLDADGQHNPKDIPKFIEKLEKGADIVSGSRFLYKKTWGTWKRIMGIKALTFQARICAGLKLTDIQSGYRGYNARIFKKIKLKQAGMGFSVELPIKAKKQGFTFVEIPIEIKKPFRIKSFKSVFKQGINVGIAILKYSFFS